MAGKKAPATTCPECGIEPGKELTLEEYEQLWADSPRLDLALSKNATVHCTECPRPLTFDRNRSPGVARPSRSSSRLGPKRKYDNTAPTG